MLTKLHIAKPSFQIGCLAAIAAMGCSESPPGARGPLPGELPAMTSISASNVVQGTSISTLRSTTSIGGFRISTSPVRVKEYRHCVEAGACSEPVWSTHDCMTAGMPVPAGRTYSTESAADDLPVTCVAPRQARAYCRWAGGDLPTSEQWLLAARGTAVHAYSWGDTAPTCGQNAAADTPSCAKAGSTGRWMLGAHPQGASPFGVQDVLLAPAELLKQSASALSAACDDEKSDGVCLVTGSKPAAIESFQSIPVDDLRPEWRSSVPTASFRCVWPEEAQ